MIDFFRRASGTVVARIFFFLLALSFAVMWGGHDALRMIGISKESTVAKVGRQTISNLDLALAIERARLNVRMSTGQDLSPEDIKAAGLDRQILEKLIQDALINQEAARLKITVSDEFLATMIQSQKAFHTPDGQFSKEAFMRFIQTFGFATEKDYVDYTKSEILRGRLLSALAANAQLPEGSLDPLYAWNEQTRSAVAMTLDPQKMVVKAVPTEDQLRDFYGKNQKLFVAPPRRTFKVLVFDASKFKEQTVGSEEVQTIYDIEKDRKFKDMKEADAKKAIKAQLAQEKSQELVMKMAENVQKSFEEGKPLSEIAKGQTVTAEGYKEFTDVSIADALAKRTPLDQAIIESAFKAEEGDLSPLDQVDDTHFVMVYVEGQKDSAQLSFADALPKVKLAFEKDEQGKMTKALVEKIQKELDSGVSFKTVAAQNGLSLTTLRADRRKVLSPDSLKLSPMAINQLFVVPLGRATLVPHTDQGGRPSFLIAQITDVKNGDPRKDPKDLADFKSRLTDQAGNDVLEMLLTHLRAKTNVEINKAYFKD